MTKAIASLSRWLSCLLPPADRSVGRNDHIVILIMDTSLEAEADYVIYLHNICTNIMYIIQFIYISFIDDTTYIHTYMYIFENKNEY